MAATAEASRLTEQYRLAQARIGAQTVALLFSVWRILNPHDLDGTFAAWLATVLAVVNQQRQRSAQLAVGYLQVIRALELGIDAEPFAPAAAGPAVTEAVTTSMLVTGPAAIRAALTKSLPLAKAVEVAQARSASAGMRHVLNGGRDTVMEAVRTDSQALGFARVTSGHACAFCALLASRGAVYKSLETADLVQEGLREGEHYHDGCHCHPEPIYRRDAALPDGSAKYRQLWRNTTAGLRGNDAINAFRRALERPAATAG